MVPLYSTPTMNTWPVEMTNVLYQSQSLCIILQLQTSPAGIRETAEQTTNPATTNEKSLCESKAFSPCNLFFHHLIVKTERRIKERSIKIYSTGPRDSTEVHGLASKISNFMRPTMILWPAMRKL
eukprot:TRINITY_DN27764_c0_g1_i2.p1 TRINITY_DN27764_c0_g1~~TRINITY_DN27764_c0_g1_i2.p1  ORF type:complete len:125 (-),score=14.34 TRINITY_DN27764_c0_g1_i2:293-667(-)